MQSRCESLPDHPPILQPARRQRNKDWATEGQTEMELHLTGRNSASKLRSVQRPRPASGGSSRRDNPGPLWTGSEHRTARKPTQPFPNACLALLKHAPNRSNCGMRIDRQIEFSEGAPP